MFKSWIQTKELGKMWQDSPALQAGTTTLLFTPSSSPRPREDPLTTRQNGPIDSVPTGHPMCLLCMRGHMLQTDACLAKNAECNDGHRNGSLGGMLLDQATFKNGFSQSWAWGFGGLPKHLLKDSSFYVATSALLPCPFYRLNMS